MKEFLFINNTMTEYLPASRSLHIQKDVMSSWPKVKGKNWIFTQNQCHSVDHFILTAILIPNFIHSFTSLSSSCCARKSILNFCVIKIKVRLSKIYIHKIYVKIFKSCSDAISLVVVDYGNHALLWSIFKSDLQAFFCSTSTYAYMNCFLWSFEKYLRIV